MHVIQIVPFVFNKECGRGTDKKGTGGFALGADNLFKIAMKIFF